MIFFQEKRRNQKLPPILNRYIYIVLWQTRLQKGINVLRHLLYSKLLFGIKKKKKKKKEIKFLGPLLETHHLFFSALSQILNYKILLLCIIIPVGSVGSDCTAAGNHFNGKTAGSTTHGSRTASNRYLYTYCTAAGNHFNGKTAGSTTHRGRTASNR